MHPAVRAFIEQHEEEAAQQGLYRRTLGTWEKQFLEQIFGPAFQYDFKGLKAEYPMKDFKGGERFVDFLYVRDGMRIAIEIDGFTTHAREISPGEFDDHLYRQNDLVLAGWMILRFTPNQIRKRPTVCQRQLLQAVGRWWSQLNSGLVPEQTKPWAVRAKAAVLLASKQDGVARPSDLVRYFGVSQRTAVNWMQRFSAEGIFEPESGTERTVRYRLRGFSTDD